MFNSLPFEILEQITNQVSLNDRIDRNKFLSTLSKDFQAYYKRNTRLPIWALQEGFTFWKYLPVRTRYTGPFPDYEDSLEALDDTTLNLPIKRKRDQMEGSYQFSVKRQEHTGCTSSTFILLESGGKRYYDISIWTGKDEAGEEIYEETDWQ